MTAVAEILQADDGSVTVWPSEHDPVARMKGMHGAYLRSGRAVVELKVRAHNRTGDMQTFLWWPSVAIDENENYQSFFPSDSTFVADHAKRAMSGFLQCGGSYCGVDNASRARDGVPAAEQPRQFAPSGSYPANDLSWYANIPASASYMCMETREDFLGGYNHGGGAGLIHLANHHLSPAKKHDSTLGSAPFLRSCPWVAIPRNFPMFYP